NDGYARLCDAGTLKVLQQIHHPDRVKAVAFGPDGNTIMTGCLDDKAWLITNIFSKQPTRKPLLHRFQILSVALPPAGPLLLAAAVALAAGGRLSAAGCGGGNGWVWDAGLAKPIGLPFWLRGQVARVAFSPDGQTFFAGDRDGNARLWTVPGVKPPRPPLLL